MKWRVFIWILINILHKLYMFLGWFICPIKDVKKFAESRESILIKSNSYRKKEITGRNIFSWILHWWGLRIPGLLILFVRVKDYLTVQEELDKYNWGSLQVIALYPCSSRTSQPSATYVLHHLAEGGTGHWFWTKTHHHIFILLNAVQFYFLLLNYYLIWIEFKRVNLRLCV